MKKFTRIIIMTLVLALIAVSAASFPVRTASAEEAAEAYSFEAKISLDAETLGAMMGGGETAEQVKMISALLDVLTIKGVSLGDQAELEVYAGADLALTLGAKSTAEATTIASSLLGSSVLAISAEQMQNMMQAGAASASGMDFTKLTEAIEALDKEQVNKDCAEIGEEFLAAIAAKKGETETGEFTVDGYTFTTRTPLNITYDELMEIELNAMKALLSKESLKPVVDVMSNGTDLAAEIDKEIEKLKTATEEEKYNLVLAIYTGEADNAYIAGEMSKEASQEEIHVGAGSVDGLVKVNVQATMEGTTMDIAVSGVENGAFEMKANIADGDTTAVITGTGDADNNIDLVFEIKSPSAPMTIHVAVADAGNDRKNLTAELFFTGMDKALLTVSGTAGKGGEILSVFEGENITVIPFEKLMDSSDQETMNTIATTVLTNLFNVVNVLKQNVPEEVGTWVTQMFMSLMQQGN